MTYEFSLKIYPSFFADIGKPGWRDMLKPEKTDELDFGDGFVITWAFLSLTVRSYNDTE